MFPARPYISVRFIIFLQLLGTLILWFGWYGFNGGSAFLHDTNHVEQLSAIAVTNTTLSAGSSGLTALFVNMFASRRNTGNPKYDLRMAMNGVLAGLVAITGGCGIVEPWSAVIIGCIAGNIYLFGGWLLIQLRLDDAVDAIPVHMMNGIWGLVAVGLFAAPDRLVKAYGHSNHVGFFFSVFSRLETLDATLLGAQIVGIFFVLGWTVAIMLPFFIYLDKRGIFRSDPLDELMGLDKSMHGGAQEDQEQVTPEILNAFEKRLEETIKRTGGHRTSIGETSGGMNSQRTPNFSHHSNSMPRDVVVVKEEEMPNDQPGYDDQA